MFTNNAIFFFYLLVFLVQAILEICLEATKAVIRHCPYQKVRHCTFVLLQSKHEPHPFSRNIFLDIVPFQQARVRISDLGVRRK